MTGRQCFNPSYSLQTPSFSCPSPIRRLLRFVGSPVQFVSFFIRPASPRFAVRLREFDVDNVAQRPVAESGVDPIRGGVGQIGVQAAEAAAALQQHLTKFSHKRGGVSTAPECQRRIHITDTVPMCRFPDRSRHGSRLDVFPQIEGTLPY